LSALLLLHAAASGMTMMLMMTAITLAIVASVEQLG